MIIMLKILKQLFEEKKRASFYTDFENGNRFNYGTVIKADEDYSVLQLISPDGDDDGIFCVETQRIYKVELQGLYEKKMAALCEGKVYPKYELTFGDDGIKNAVLSFAKKEGQIVSIELSNSECDDAVGFVESFDEEICCIKAVDEYGIDDGISYVNYEDITRIVLMSYDEKRLMRLWRYNQQ